MLKRLAASVLALTTVLTACSQSDVPSPQVSTSSASLHATSVRGGETLRSSVAEIELPPGALRTPATFVVEGRPAGEVPRIPPVAEVNSSFIMGEVPGRSLLGVWHITSDAQDLRTPATLRLKPQGALGAQQASQTVSEVFVRDNVSGRITIVGTFTDGASLDIEDFGDRINEIDASIDLTYFAYRAPTAAYNATCAREGGSTAFGYCSFAEKKITGGKGLRSQSLRAQSQYLRTISWNLGNVAQSCSASTGGANYNFKLCYTSTLRRISDQILKFEQTYKPDIIMFQEVWHGDCRYTGESWYGTYGNQRLCASNAPRGHAIYQILGSSGSRYHISCTPTEDVPGARLVVNGYECIAVDIGVLRFTATNSLRTACEAYDSTRNYLGRDTGYQVAQVTRSWSGGNELTLVNAHLSGTVDEACRQAQLQTLESSSLTLNQPFNLFAGDWNTEPLNDSTVGGQAFREVFSGPWTSYSSTLAQTLDIPNQDTAFYVHDNLALDHVMSNTFTGNCVRGSSFEGTDHTWTDCSLNSSSF